MEFNKIMLNIKGLFGMHYEFYFVFLNWLSQMDWANYSLDNFFSFMFWIKINNYII